MTDAGSQTRNLDFILGSQQPQGKVVDTDSNAPAIFHPGPGMTEMIVMIPGDIETGSGVNDRRFEIRQITGILDHLIKRTFYTVISVRAEPI